MRLHEPSIQDSSVRGVRLLELRHVEDALRGDLTVLEFDESLPFQPRRCFWTHGIPDRAVRGEHAHRECSQVLIPVHGVFTLRVDDGCRREEWCLDRPHRGLLVPPGIWLEAEAHAPDAVLLALASHTYDPEDYIRDYTEFLRMMGGCPRSP